MKFLTAYQQLQPLELEFVDGFIGRVDIESAKRFEPITTTLERVAETIKVGDLDERAADMLAKPVVKAAIRERVDELARERDLTPERIVREHIPMAFANMGDYLNIGEDGIGRPDLSGLSREQLSAIQQFEYEEEYSRGKNVTRMKIKLYSKQASLAELAKWNGLDKMDNASHVAYRTIPDELTRLSADMPLSDVADKYAQFIADD